VQHTLQIYIGGYTLKTKCTLCGKEFDAQMIKEAKEDFWASLQETIERAKVLFHSQQWNEDIPTMLLEVEEAAATKLDIDLNAYYENVLKITREDDNSGK
jgi:hypothetical protein